MRGRVWARRARRRTGPAVARTPTRRRPGRGAHRRRAWRKPQQSQENLIKELANLKPSGDPDVDDAWRAGIQTRFAATVAEQRTKEQLLAEIVREEQMAAPVDIGLLDLLPEEEVD